MKFKLKWYVSVFVRGQWKFIDIYFANNSKDAIKFAKREHKIYKNLEWKADYE